VNITRAYANRGRWIVECECRSASQIQPEVRRWRCEECGAAYTVLWPIRRREIEELLRPRRIVNQNWQVGERVEHLITENIEHGVTAERG
jgi:hypothetical protein